MTPGVSTLLRGARLSLRGVRHALLSGAVLKSCWPLALIGLLVGILLQVLAAWLALRFTEAPADATRFVVVAFWFLRVAALVGGVIAASLLAVIATGLLVPLVAERVLLDSLRALDPERARRLAAGPGIPLAAQVAGSLRRLGGFLGWTALALLASLVPLVGLVLGPSLEVWVAGRFLSWELLEPALSLSGRGHRQQDEYLRSRRWVSLGFALPFVPALAIPLLGPAVFAVAQAAVAVLLHEELRDLMPSATPERASSAADAPAMDRAAPPL